MISTILIDGVIKLIQVVRYSKKPATARVYVPGAKVPEKVLQASKYDDNRFIDDETCKEYRLTRTGMVAI